VTADERLLKCRGGFGAITLYVDKMIIDESSWRIAKSYELPVTRIRAVIVERKSVIPFATIMVLIAIATVAVKYNALWFLVNLTPPTAALMSMTMLAICVVSAIPALLRAIFVNVAVTWDGEPSSFRVRFVPAHMGRRLAKRFHEASTGS
jgi:hypothetical protein